MTSALGIITNYIEADEVNIALQKLKGDYLKKDLTGWSAYASVISLNKLILTALKNKKTCLSDAESIYSLAKLCCEVECMWEQDRPACMQCLYHVIRYLLSQFQPKLAKQLCEYYFKLRQKQNFIKWEEKEILVLSNTVIYFVHYIYELSKDIDKVPYSQDLQVLNYFRFVLDLSELNDFASTSQLFQVIFFLSRRAQNLLSHDNYINFSMDVMNWFLKHLKRILNVGVLWIPKDENISYSMTLLSDVIFVLKSNDFSEEVVIILLDFMDCLKNLTSDLGQPLNGQKAIDFDLLQNTFKMCLYSTEDSFTSYFDEFSKLLSTRTNGDCFPFIHACLSTFRTKIGSLLYKDDVKMKQLFPGLLKIYVQSRSKMIEEQRSKRSELLHAFTNALYFLNTSKISSSTLVGLFKYVIMFFKEFDSLIMGNKTSFEFGVNYCINVIQTYKELDLYKEAATLAKHLMKRILLLDPEFLSLDSFEVKLGHLLNFFVHSFSKMGLVTEAQIALVAFVGVHPKFIDIIFKYWAELKTICPENHLKDSTSYDIINSEKSVIEEKWPPCKVQHINIEHCLLEELRAYSKHRELHIGPVVAVYRLASKLVKDKTLLASIVTATVDAISSDEYIPTLKNLHLSLDNLLNSNLKMKVQETDVKKLCHQRFVIGDILYQIIRCDIVELRKKAEEELSLMNLPPKAEIPIIEGETSNITPAYTYLKACAQKELFEKMAKVIHYWKMAEKVATLEDKQFIHFRYMKGMAYIFRLYSYKTKEREIWETIYRLAKKVSNHKYLVLAVTELLVLTKNIDSQWLKEAEHTVKNEAIISKKNYVYSLFFINLGKYFYANQKLDEAMKLIEKLDEVTLKRFFLINAQYKLLYFALERDKIDHSPKKVEFTLYILIQIFESILFLIKNSRWKTFCEKCVLQCLLLEYSYIISKMYYDLRLMRHARCYAKKQLIVAQRLALPIRVCEFLTLLNLADLQTGNRMDAKEKLFGLDSILELDEVRVAEYSDNIDIAYFSKTTSEKDVGEPAFLSHSVGCDCLVCDNVDYLLLTVEAFTLKGIFTTSAGAKSLAKHIFEIGKSLIEFTNEKVKKRYSCVPNRYDETKVRFYLNLTIAHINWDERKDALLYNQMTLQSLENCCRVLQEEIIYHSAALDWHCYEKVPSVVYKPKLYKETSDSSLPIVKTPEQNRAQCVFVPKGVKIFSSSKKFKVPVSPRPSFVKKCIFDDSEDSIDEGKFTNKENFETPVIKENKSRKDKGELAVPLPLSPCNSVKKTLCFDKQENMGTPKTSNWFLETPKDIKTYSSRTRKVQTEKKLCKKGPAIDLFSTPFPTKTVPEIKVFCDEDDDNKDVTKTVKRRGRPPKAKTTVKKTAKKEKRVDVKSIGGRKLFESDTEEEMKSRRVERRLFVESDELEIDSKKKISFSSSDDSAIIDSSFSDKTTDRVCLPLTPSTSGLEDSLNKLSINDKKNKLSLSTKNMRKLKISQDTPQSSLRRTVLRK